MKNIDKELITCVINKIETEFNGEISLLQSKFVRVLYERNTLN